MSVVKVACGRGGGRSGCEMVYGGGGTLELLLVGRYRTVQYSIGQ